MLKLLISVSALALLSVAARAADLPVTEAPPAPASLAAGYDWSGIYFGGHGGYIWGQGDDDFGSIDDLNGWLAGGQIGVNVQWKSLVFGAEGDASWLDDVSASEDIGAVAPLTLDVQADWLASARGRLGIALDRFLFYGTGGAAWVDVDADVPGVGSDSNVLFGWVAGGGGELAVTRNLTVGAEYLHYEFGDSTFDIGGGSFDGGGSADMVRGRVNIKFGSFMGH